MSWPQVINVQLSSYNTSEKASFTVNLGISIETFGKVWGYPILKGPLKEYKCDLRSRIGRLLPHQCNKWWEVTTESSSDHLAEEVLTDIRNHAFPWFEKLSNYAALAHEFEIQKLPAKAALAHHFAGNVSQAQSCMEEAYVASDRSFFSEIIRLAEFCSISLPARRD